MLSFYHSVSKFRTLKRQLTSISRLKDKARLLSSEVQVKHRMEIQKFEGVGDRFKGVTVISKDEHCNVETCMGTLRGMDNTTNHHTQIQNDPRD